MIVHGDILTAAGVMAGAFATIGSSGQIESLEESAAGSFEDFSGKLILPGFIDIHIHGGGGCDFMDGTVDAVRTIVRTHAAYGTTSLLATTLTADRSEVDRSITAVVKVMNEPNDDEARIVGIHLEGPYICAQKRGAQPLAPIRLPSIDELTYWQELSGNNIRKVTLAPELDGAEEFIRYATGQGIAISIGHTNADNDTVISAINAGATQATHLFNAMSPLSHRSPGAAGALLASDRVICELICDGVHVAPEVVKIAICAAGVDRIVLITDAMSGASMPDGNYELGGQTVIVKSGEAKFADGTLAGSVLMMNVAFRNVQMFAKISTANASRMTSYTAARAIGIDHCKGTVEVGKDADLVVLNKGSGDVQATMCQGKFIYKKPNL